MELDWVAAGLAAPAEGRPLPPPFDDPDHVWRVLDSDPWVPGRTVGRAVPPERPPFEPPAYESEPAPMSQIVGPAAAMVKLPSPPVPPTPLPAGAVRYALMVRVGELDPSLRMSPPHMAVPAVLGAAEADPLQAALDAVHAAVAGYGEDYPTVLWEVHGRRSR